jgi:16S rRNA pseudouridine516 synthase
MSARRLDQLLASLGYCSRSEVRVWLKAGRISVAGKVAADPGAKPAVAAVRVDGEPLDHPEGLLLMVNKPVGLTCSHDPREAPLIYELLPARWRERNPVVTTIGRLDKETSGLILLTDHTELVHRLTSPKHKVPKIYHVTTDRDLSPALVDVFAAGTLQLDGEKEACAPAGLSLLGSREAEVTLIEGKYHQVRRMFAAAAGVTVTALHRTSFGHLTLGDLAPGRYRELSVEEFGR